MYIHVYIYIYTYMAVCKMKGGAFWDHAEVAQGAHKGPAHKARSMRAWPTRARPMRARHRTPWNTRGMNSGQIRHAAGLRCLELHNEKGKGHFSVSFIHIKVCSQGYTNDTVCRSRLLTTSNQCDIRRCFANGRITC